jgi:chemotaxis protein MotA
MMEYTTFFGLLASLSLVGVAMVLGGHVHSFLDLPSLLIVVGGTLTVVITSFSFTDVLRAFGTIGRALATEIPGFKKLAEHLIKLSQAARTNGMLSLQKEAATEPHAFLKQGLSLAVDGAPAETVEKVLYHDTVSLMERHEQALAVLRRASEVSPSMGLIGTLIGLVQMLGSLSDPSAIGPAMALALLTTLYGAMLAYMILTPLATKLEKAGHNDLLTRKLITTGILSIIKQENPRQLELHLNSLLPPAHRIQVFK